MKNVDSPFKLEHFEVKDIGWNQFSNPCTKGQNNSLGDVGAQIGCFQLPKIGVGWGSRAGGGGLRTRKRPP